MLPSAQACSLLPLVASSDPEVTPIPGHLWPGMTSSLDNYVQPRGLNVEVNSVPETSGPAQSRLAGTDSLCLASFRKSSPAVVGRDPSSSLLHFQVYLLCSKVSMHQPPHLEPCLPISLPERYDGDWLSFCGFLL